MTPESRGRMDGGDGGRSVLRQQEMQVAEEMKAMPRFSCAWEECVKRPKWQIEVQDKIAQGFKSRRVFFFPTFLPFHHPFLFLHMFQFFFSFSVFFLIKHIDLKGTQIIQVEGGDQ